MTSLPLPTGVVTFLMTDVVKSSQAWLQDMEAMNRSLIAHDEIVESVLMATNGTLIKERGEGDSCFIVFNSVGDAFEAAIQIQERLQSNAWLSGPALQVRMAIHTGEGILRSGDYYGPTVNKCGRLRSCANANQILVSDSSHTLSKEAANSQIRFRDLGLHRLPDVADAFRIFEIEQEGVASIPIRSLSATPNNIPRQLNRFVGRGQSMASVTQKLENSRLVTLVGAGGAGKTRLATQTAESLYNDYPDGVWFVDLVPCTTMESIVSAIATSMNLGQSSLDIRSLGDQISKSEVLIVLDNCEHVIPESASISANLLDLCNNIKIIATSREPLGILGETLYRVPGLEVPNNTLQSKEELLAFESAQLFHDRSLAVGGTGITELNYLQVKELIRTVDGIALAIEFLASHTSAFSADTLLREVQSYLRPNQESSIVHSRHKTMETTIRWSYDRLNQDEQLVFRRLAIFDDGCNLIAAESICCTEEVPEAKVREAVSKLVQKNLIVATEGARGEMRYRLLQPFRDFAETLLDSDSMSANAEHQRYYKRLAEAMGREIESERQALWLDIIDSEVENIRHALTWTRQHRLHELASFVFSFRDYWNRRGFLAESKQWHLEAVASLPETPTLLLANLYNSLTALAFRQGDFVSAREYSINTGSLALAINDEILEAKSRNNLAMVRVEEGNYDEARSLYLSNLEPTRKWGEMQFHGTTLSNLGDLETVLKNWEQAIEYLERAVDVFNQEKNQAKQARVSCNLAIALYGAGDTKSCLEVLSSALTVWRAVHDPQYLSEGLNLLSSILFHQGDNENAVVLAGASRQILARCGVNLRTSDLDIQSGNLSSCRASLGRQTVQNLLRKGESMPMALAIDLAISICQRKA